MFVGHYAAALVAKGVDRAIPLWTLMLAAQLLDVLWAGFVLLGVEQIHVVPGFTAASPLELVSVPFSHSFTSAAIWSLVAVMAYNTFAQYGRVRGVAAVVGVVVLVHWFFDALVHPAQLPLYGNRYPVGLGLWRYPALSATVEVTLFLAGLVVFLMATRPRAASLRYGIVALAIGLVLVQVAAAVGPPPPSVTVVGVTGLVTPLAITAVVYMLERREPRPLP